MLYMICHQIEQSNNQWINQWSQEFTAQLIKAKTPCMLYIYIWFFCFCRLGNKCPSMNMHDAWFANDENTHTWKTVIMAYTIRKFHPCTSLNAFAGKHTDFPGHLICPMALTCGRMSNLKLIYLTQWLAVSITQWRKVDRRIRRRIPCMRPSQCIAKYGMWHNKVIIPYLWNETKRKWNDLFNCTNHPPRLDKGTDDSRTIHCWIKRPQNDSALNKWSRTIG